MSGLRISVGRTPSTNPRFLESVNTAAAHGVPQQTLPRGVREHR
jgi:hypothetical protein